MKKVQIGKSLSKVHFNSSGFTESLVNYLKIHFTFGKC